MDDAHQSPQLTDTYVSAVHIIYLSESSGLGLGRADESLLCSGSALNSVRAQYCSFPMEMWPRLSSLIATHTTSISSLVNK